MFKNRKEILNWGEEALLGDECPVFPRDAWLPLSMGAW